MLVSVARGWCYISPAGIVRTERVPCLRTVLPRPYSLHNVAQAAALLNTEFGDRYLVLNMSERVYEKEAFDGRKQSTSDE